MAGRNAGLLSLIPWCRQASSDHGQHPGGQRPCRSMYSEAARGTEIFCNRTCCPLGGLVLLGLRRLLGAAILGALIFDFDGVIADSEAIANTVLAETVSDLGHATTLDQALTRYSGKRWTDVMTEIEAAIGRPLPADFSSALQRATLDRFRTDRKEVGGASDFILQFAHIPRCIASSSSMDRLQLCLSVLGLEAEFDGRVFSADMVARGKPHPDIFLLAAAKLGAKPGECLVIEDSAGGIRAAVAAGMTAIGLCAASHIRDGHHATLRSAGAVHLANSWREVEHIARQFFQMSR